MSKYIPSCLGAFVAKEPQAKERNRKPAFGRKSEARSLKFGLVQAHWLMPTAAPAIDRDSLAAESIGQLVGLVDGGWRSLLVEIYRLTYRRITMLLERRLHSYVPLRLDVVGSLEEPANGGRDFSQLLNAARLRNASFKPLAVKPAFGSYLLKERIYL